MTGGTTEWNGTTRRRIGARIGLAVVAVTLLGVGVACGEPEPPPPPPVFSVTTSPPMFPAFDPEIVDYVVRCNGAPVRVVVDAPDDHPTSIEGGPFQTGRLEADVALTAGQALSVLDLSLLRDYSVRCLPSDYPAFTVSGRGQQAEYYLTAPFGFTGWSLTPQYATIFDRNGVPVWWSKTRLNSNFVTLFDNLDLGVVRNDDEPPEARSLLFGNLVQEITADGMPADAVYDNHDLLRLANGNYVFVYNTVTTMDVRGAFPSYSADSGLEAAEVLDHVVVEVQPDGTVVWSWKASDHIAPSEMDPQWEEFVYTSLHPNGYDIYHWNSVEATPTGYVMSYRHLDAIYAVTRDGAGTLEWKLGGSARPESLTPDLDPVFVGGGGFGGQHDARILADGTVSLYDNGTDRGRAPRAVRYRLALNEPVGTGGTATLVEQVSSPTVGSSFCCGSARRLPGGHWLFGFGGTGVIEEVAPTGRIDQPDGTPVFRIEIGDGLLEYRTEPIPQGRLNWWFLRIAMDIANP